MFISDTAIKRPVLTIVAMLLLVVFGLVALVQLDTDEYPEIDAPIVVVAIPYPGASPDVVEREVIEPIEEVISGISGVDRMTSNSLDSFGNIIVEFDFSRRTRSMATPGDSRRDLRDPQRAAAGDGGADPDAVRPADQPIVSLTLSSPGLTGAELTRMADPDITRRLRGISGRGVGRSRRRHRARAGRRDPAARPAGRRRQRRAARAGAAVAEPRLARSAGSKANCDERTIRLQGPPRCAGRFQAAGRLAVGRPRSSASATSPTSATPPRSRARSRSTTTRKRSASTSSSRPGSARRPSPTTSATRVGEVQQTLPAGVTLRVVRDAGVRVANSVAGVQEALLEGAALTVLVVFLFLNSWRSTVITGLALPVSVLASFIAVWVFGFTLNTMSLLGLSLAIGILIDDAIVVRENIVRHVEMGKDHYRAAFDGTDEIGLAVTATTMSIVVVFIPIAFIGGIAGQWFKPFGLTIACSVLVSLFVSFSLDPMLSAYWPDPHMPMERRSFLSRAARPVQRWFDRQAEGYKGVIAWALDHRVAMVVLALATFVGALALPAMGLVGAGFVPETDESEFTVDIETPPGSNLAYTQLKAQEVSRIARAAAGSALYLQRPSAVRATRSTKGTVFVKLPPKSERVAIAGRGRRRRSVAELVHLAGVDDVDQHRLQPGEKQIQLQLQGRMPASWRGWRDAMPPR